MFTLVAADSRAKRDGKFIEKLGTYNPNTNPATIDLNFDRCVEWVMQGAQPSDTVRAILSYKGVMLKKHLLEGVKKGALTAEQAEARFEQWVSEKVGKIEGKKDSLSAAREKARKDALKAEEEKAQARKAAAAAALVAAEAPEVAAEEVVAEEAPAEGEATAENAAE
jgi:small subunit ribosomal protein S16